MSDEDDIKHKEEIKNIYEKIKKLYEYELPILEEKEGLVLLDIFDPRLDDVKGFFPIFKEVIFEDIRKPSYYPDWIPFEKNGEIYMLQDHHITGIISKHESKEEREVRLKKKFEDLAKR